MTVKEIVKAYLKDHDIEGLCAPECGCGVDDLAPCGDGPYYDCHTAKSFVLTEDDMDKYSYLDAEVGDTIYVPVDVPKEGT